MALEAGMTVVDVSVTHPASSTTLAAAAQTDGAAADKRDKRDEAKRRAYNRLEPHG
jgi:multisubunit Na+/H+ antiporter MnhG subunit